MTRRQPLRVLLPNTVSHAVMDFVGHPFMFRFGLDGAYQDCRESSWAESKPLSFLAWVNLWIRLALGHAQPISGAAYADLCLGAVSDLSLAVAPPRI